MNSHISINHLDLDRVSERVSFEKGIETKRSILTDSSTISGWQNCLSSIEDGDILRKQFGEAEIFHIESINSFNDIWQEKDKQLANDMRMSGNE